MTQLEIKAIESARSDLDKALTLLHTTDTMGSKDERDEAESTALKLFARAGEWLDSVLSSNVPVSDGATKDL
jgi:hypothetical protein